MRYLGKYYQKMSDGSGYQVWLPKTFFEEMITEAGLEGAKAATTPGTSELKPPTAEE